MMIIHWISRYPAFTRCLLDMSHPHCWICGVVKLDEINGSPHLIHPKAKKHSIMGIKKPMNGLMTIPQALGNSAFQLLTMLSSKEWPMVIGTNIMDPKFSSKLLVLFHGETHGLESWSTPYFRFSRVLEGFPRSVCARSSESYCADFGLEGVPLKGLYSCTMLYNDVHHYI